MATSIKRTFGTPTNNKIFTLSTWFKKTTWNYTEPLLSGGSSSRPSPNILMASDGKLKFSSYNGTGYDAELHTSALYRDTSAWYHIVVAVDTTQATSSNRMKFYVNGEQITSFSTANYPSQNFVLQMNEAHTHVIGGYTFGGVSSNGTSLFSHYHFIDGTAYDASAFGQYDANGVWTIKTSPSVTYGNNGFFIFKDGNSLTDQSGNNNNWTLHGGTLTKTEDSPSNVFSTMNALNTYVPAILSTGNLKISGTGSDGGSASTLGMTSGKWYWEVKYTDEIGGDPVIGIVNSIGANKIKGTTSLSVTSGSGVWCLFNLTSGGVGIQENGVFSVYPPTTLADGDILNIALDVDAQKLWYGKNGTWFNSGNPANGTNATSTNLTSGETWFAYLEKRNSSSIADFNFGNGYFGTTAVASAGTNASGNGIFEYDVPTGYTALSTKGLNL